MRTLNHSASVNTVTYWTVNLVSKDTVVPVKLMIAATDISTHRFFDIEKALEYRADIVRKYKPSPSAQVMIAQHEISVYGE